MAEKQPLPSPWSTFHRESIFCRDRGAEPGTQGRYQIGEVQARSWITLRKPGSPHAAGRASGESLLQSKVLHRQEGFSTTRA